MTYWLPFWNTVTAKSDDFAVKPVSAVLLLVKAEFW